MCGTAEMSGHSLTAPSAVHYDYKPVRTFTTSEALLSRRRMLATRVCEPGLVKQEKHY